MPDLHGWITQQIDEAERLARRAAALCGCHPPAPSWSFRDGDEPTDGRIVVVDDPHPALKRKISRRWNCSYEGLFMAEHIVRHDPEAVLRRCAADRKILARHRLDPNAYWSERAMCQGCGVSGDCDWPVTDNLNDCPELLDLAEGYGLTPEILAILDRPERGERPEPSGRSVLHDSIASMYGALYKQVLETTFASISAAEKALMTGDATGEPIGFLTVTEAPETSPEVKAMQILGPELKKIPGYIPTTDPEAAP